MFFLSFLPLSSSSIPLTPSPLPFHFEPFSSRSYSTRWFRSSLPNYTGEWKLDTSELPQAIPDERMLYMNSPLSYYSLSTLFPVPLNLTHIPLVLQYELRYQERPDCGGSYIKLFNDPHFAPSRVSNETQYSIMFGPDICGSDKKIHFIFKSKDRRTGALVEHHLVDPPEPKDDTLTHLYTLIARPNNSVEILIDSVSIRNASVLRDFEPPLSPPKEMPDPDDRKPSDWIDEEKVDDPDAEKPEDWDENAPPLIPDPEKSEPPDGWLPDEPPTVPDPLDPEKEIRNPKCRDAPGCGKWEAPKIGNPQYRGKWRPPKIPNPMYKGEWKPKLIQNPDWVELKEPHDYGVIVGAGFEDWMVSRNVGFANVYIGTNEEDVRRWNEVHFKVKAKDQSDEKDRMDEEAGRGKWKKKEAEEETVKEEL